MAVEETLNSVCFRTGALLLVLLLAIMMATGSDEERRRTRADELQTSGVIDNLTNSSSLGRQRHRPTYLNSGKNNSNSGVGCVELRSKRYVSDGRCTSIRPLIEVVCSGLCLPVRTLPWYTDYVRAWAGTSQAEWQCVDDVVRKRKLTLVCEDGTTTAYRVRVVKNCRCKQVVRRRHVEPATNKGKKGKGGDLQAGDLEGAPDVNEKKGKRGRNNKQRLRHHKNATTAVVTTSSP